MTGGRRDLTYSVECKHCEGSVCVPCGEKIRFETGPTDLQDTEVVISDLDSHLNYTFTVETHSGVSQFGMERPIASITTALDYNGELEHKKSSYFCSDLTLCYALIGFTLSMCENNNENEKENYWNLICRNDNNFL